jgi:hypothetical protein
MSKLHKVEKEIYEGCAVQLLCEGSCRYEHRKVYDPVTKNVKICPAYYRFTFEKKRHRPGSRKRSQKGKLVMRELR